MEWGDVRYCFAMAILVIIIIWRPFWVAMAAILNQKWPPKYKNPPILAKFGFQVDFVLAN